MCQHIPCSEGFFKYAKRKKIRLEHYVLFVEFDLDMNHFLIKLSLIDDSMCLEPLLLLSALIRRYTFKITLGFYYQVQHWSLSLLTFFFFAYALNSNELSNAVKKMKPTVILKLQDGKIFSGLTKMLQINHALWHFAFLIRLSIWLSWSCSWVIWWDS